MQPVLSVVKLATGGNREKCLERENMQPSPSTGKRANGVMRGKNGTDAERGKTNNWCQARENVQPVPSAGKKRLFLIEKNMQLVLSAENMQQSTSQYQDRENLRLFWCFLLIGLKK